MYIRTYTKMFAYHVNIGLHVDNQVKLLLHRLDHKILIDHLSSSAYIRIKHLSTLMILVTHTYMYVATYIKSLLHSFLF